MTNTHTVQFEGETHKRTSQSRAYSHAVAVVRAPFAAHGYEYPEKAYVLSWSSTEALAQKAASTARGQRHFDGTERYSRSGYTRRRVQGNGTLVYSKVEVLPVTRVTKELDPKRLVATYTKRAEKEGQRAVYWATLDQTTVTNDMVADFAGSAARWAVSNAHKALAAQAGATCSL